MYIVLRSGLRGRLRFGGWRAGRVMKIADPHIIDMSCIASVTCNEKSVGKLTGFAVYLISEFICAC